MQLRNIRGNVCTAKYDITVEGKKQVLTLNVGSEPVELPEEQARYMLNLFSAKNLEVVSSNGDNPAADVPAKEPVATLVEKKVVPENQTEFEPKIDKIEDKVADKKPEETLEEKAKKLAPNQYMCRECRFPHMNDSGRGKKHLQFKVEV